MKSEVTLEALSINHARELYQLSCKNRAYLRQWLPWLDHVKECADTQSFIRGAQQAEITTHFCVYSNQLLCGIVDFHQVNNQNRTAKIGYWLDADHQGKGIMTKAVEKLIAMGFQEYGFHKIEIHCAEHNSQSRALAQRLGFKFEALLRDCEWLYNQYVNHAIYSMLRTEHANSKDT